MELSQLRMFKTIADLGSIARAAEELHCVPSNITTRIRKLEEELGQDLFVRQGRGLRLSQNGQVFLEHVNKILIQCDAAKQSMQQDIHPTGLFKLGAIESSAMSRLPSLLAAFHQEYPDVQIQFQTDRWPVLQHEVLNFRLDAAVIAAKPTHPNIGFAALYQEPLILIAPATHPIIQSPQDLAGLGFFMWPAGCPYRQILESWTKSLDIPIHITDMASNGAILGCVSAGAGLAMVPKSIFDRFIQKSEIHHYQFDALTPVTNYFIWNKNVTKHPAKEAFLSLANRLNI
ncbi:LysR family transcriptional regulator [Marinomonas ostreistagni]|uniref:LysR family transcriptional regulator n=1 Tax=Marinomonas ostreistagni TaxID=359209 RepID=A0ABS0ZED1_9GAMM|nr:LysR family transcriptional regulator [Marinomonas ostreistagni]MBJ7552032.1 LysR family transcriptional regulator [Marinomonas ostreistagni]